MVLADSATAKVVFSRHSNTSREKALGKKNNKSNEGTRQLVEQYASKVIVDNAGLDGASTTDAPAMLMDVILWVSVDVSGTGESQGRITTYRLYFLYPISVNLLL